MRLTKHTLEPLEIMAKEAIRDFSIFFNVALIRKPNLIQIEFNALNISGSNLLRQ